MKPLFESLERRVFFASNGTIGGTVFDDLNGDGRRDSGEPGLADQRVFLDLNFDGQFQASEPSRLTDSGGAYTFTGVPAGIRRVRHEVPSGCRLTFPGAIFYDLSMTGSNNVTGRNFGNTATAVIRGAVFDDLNGNGVRDAGDRGLAGWTVFLDKDNDGKVDSNEKVRVTNSAGDYRFAGLTPGTYFVKVVQQTGFVRTAPTSGVHSVTLAAGGGISNRNFGQA